MKLLPALDLLQGRVVSLVGGVPGSQIVDEPDPARVYERWVQEGAEWLHVVDLDAALGRGDHRLLVQRILEERRLKVQVGGGVRSSEQVRWLLENGAERVVVGTRGVEDPAWLHEVAQAHPDRIVQAVDARQGVVVTRGWRASSGRDVVEFCHKLAHVPLAAILFTSVDVEGRLAGVDHAAVVQVYHATQHPLIVAGGITTYEDLRFLKGLGVDGAILGAALYQGRIQFAQAKNLVEDV